MTYKVFFNSNTLSLWIYIQIQFVLKAEYLYTEASSENMQLNGINSFLLFILELVK